MSLTTINDHVRRGAYGVTVAGIAGVAEFLVDAPRGWDEVVVTARAAEAQPAPAEHVGEDDALLHLSAGGWMTMRRVPRRAELWLPSGAFTPAAVAHPYLASIALVHAHWADHDGFHAGAFVDEGGVWGILGDKGSGKSTILASLAARDVPVVCDDVLVLSGLTALAGPRTIDLRPEAAQQLQRGLPLGRVGARERWRLELAPVAPELPFRGWIKLAWNAELTASLTRGADRLRALVPHRGLRVASNAATRMIELAALPMIELGRPRAWSSHESAIDLLLDRVAAH